MQDVLAEADLSAGAVYRYFSGKEAIIAAIATEALTEVSGVFDRVFDTDVPPPLDEVLAEVFATLERLDAAEGVTQLAIQVWAEALRSPTLASHFASTTAEVRQSLTRLIELYQRQGWLSSEFSAERVARVVGALVPGFIVQRALMGDVDTDTFCEGLRGLLAENLVGGGQRTSA